MEPEEKVINIEYNFNLAPYPLSKKEFITTIKAYLKALKAHLESNGKTDRVEKFMAGAQAFVKRITSDFENWTFYQTTSEKTEGGLVFSFWEDESGPGPHFYFFKDGVKEVKC